jgi:hypothetical protein
MIDPKGEIFYETLKLHQNTVNGCFPDGTVGGRLVERAAKPRAMWFMMFLRYSTNGQSAPVPAPAHSELSALPKPSR